MDRWLAAVEADKSDKSLAQKVADNRPDDVHDQCSNVPGVEAAAVPGVGTVCENETLQTRFGTPHTVAGESIATDTNKCALKPLRRTDYYPIAFTDEEWAQLETAFPSGVCDWSKPGPAQTGTIPWQTYQSGGSGDVVFGGKPLGPAPSGSGTGWSSTTWRQAVPGGASGKQARVAMTRAAKRRALARRRARAQRRAALRRHAAAVREAKRAVALSRRLG